MPYAKTSQRAEQRALREEMRALGMSRQQVAAEFSRRYRLRPRAAWRNAHGWSLTEAAKQINIYAAQAGLDGDGATVTMTAAHLCEHENWPGEGPRDAEHKPTGRKPTPYLLSLLAAVYGCAIHDLLDLDDHRYLPPADRLTLDKTTPTHQSQGGGYMASHWAQSERPDQSTAIRHRAGAPTPTAVNGEWCMPTTRNIAPSTVLGQLDSGLGFGTVSYSLFRGGPVVLGFEDIQRIVAALQNARRYADIAVAGYFRRQLAACALSDGTRGPKEILPLVLAIVAATEHVAREAKSAIRPELLAVAARGAEFAGWLYRDSAAPNAASYWHDRAAECAQVTGDGALQGYVLLKKSQVAWDERDAWRMLMLARAAQAGPWVLPPRVKAEAAQQEARGHAMLGGAMGIVAAKLDEARCWMTEEQSGSAADGSALAPHYGTALLALQTAICYCEAGQPARAVEIYQEHLTQHAFSRRDYGYFRALAGIALARASRPDAAAAAGSAALAIATATGSMRTFRELSRLLDELRSWRSRPTVQAFGRELVQASSRE
jgi:hypothetical protein